MHHNFFIFLTRCDHTFAVLKMVVILDNFEIDCSSETSLRIGAEKILEYVKPDWKKEELKFKMYTDGITNRIIGIWNEDFNDQVLLRVYGEKTELFIDRKIERENMELFYEHECGAELFAVFKNGLSYAFIPGTTLTTDSVRKEEIWPTVGKHLAKLHRIETSSREACLFTKFAKYIRLLPKNFKKDDMERLTAAGISKNSLEQEMKELQEVLTPLNCPIVFSHNDILLNNIIWNNGTKTVSFIDYEYAAPNFQPYDIANHFCEFVGVDVNLDYKKLYPDAEFQRKWIKNYLSCYFNKPCEEISTDEVEKWRRWVNKFALASHLFWSAWALLQACYSSIDFDFAQYAIIRVQEYKTRKEEFLAL